MEVVENTLKDHLEAADQILLSSPPPERKKSRARSRTRR
jgi:hypothetical protein